MCKSYNPFSLEGKKILITGASSGIGQATAIECSRMGAYLVITARNQQRLTETLNQLEGDNHIMVICDLTRHGELEDLVASIPVLDGVVLCAGSGLTKPFLYSDSDSFNKIFNINLFSPVELLRLMVKQKKLSKYSSVVFVSSIGGVRHVTIGNDIYDASKSALHSIMRSAAKELAPKQIRVNSVNPGMINTRLIQELKVSEEQIKTNIQLYPLKRLGEPVEIAYGIIYLLSNASAWITGQALVIDGGRTI
jgi:NAD(P)-dependent dehydrogenase (short-subunit alcohol dehydrogenase family)